MRPDTYGLRHAVRKSASPVHNGDRSAHRAPSGREQCAADRKLLLDSALPLGRRGGYFNENGEISYRLKTAEKTVLVEADIWQGLKTETVPFNLKVGLRF
jgi:hypothetical protein